MPQMIVDMRDYFPTRPHTSWRMHTTNFLTGGEGIGTITIEAPSTQDGIVMTPWLFRKNSPDAYWGARRLEGGWTGEEDLRWYVVAADYAVPTLPLFQQYFWVAGHDELVRGTDTLVRQVAYRSSGAHPPSLLLPKAASLPWIWHGDLGMDYLSVLPPSTLHYSPTPPEPTDGFLGSWWIAVSWIVPGERLQASYWEGFGGEGIETSTWLIREDWEFQRGMGLVTIRQKLVMDPTQPVYRMDTDFQLSSIQRPDILVERLP